MDKNVAQTFSWLCSCLFCQKVNYLKIPTEPFRNIQFYWGPSWLDKKKSIISLFAVRKSQSYKVEFCSYAWKTVITGVAQINRGEQELPPPCSSWGHSPVTEDHNIQLGGEKRIFVQKIQHFRTRSAATTRILLVYSNLTEAAANTGSSAENRFITNLQTE